MIFGEDLILLFLIVARVTGVFIVIPVFNSKNIPMLAKTWFIVFISLLIVPTTVVGTLDFSNMLMIAYYIVTELFNGIVMGSAVSLTLTAVYVAGKLVDTGIGFSMVSVMSALDNNQMPVSANLYYIIVMLIFLITNAHHAIIRALVRSFDVIPLGEVLFNELILKELVFLIAGAMEFGVKVAMPITLTIVIANVLLGILAKAMPGMNVFVIGMPFKILVGLTIMIITMPYFYNIFRAMLDGMLDEMNKIIILYNQ